MADQIDDLTTGMVAIIGRLPESPRRGPVGAGFVVSRDGLILTCAHVLAQTDWPHKAWDVPVQVRFQADRRFFDALVQEGCFSERTEGDYALLKLTSDLPNGVTVLPLGPAAASEGHTVRFRGYPIDHPGILGGDGRVLALETRDDGWQELQLHSEHATHGFSGGPVWDPDLGRTGRAIGLFQRGRGADEAGRLGLVSFAMPAEALVEACPRLKLTPISGRLQDARQYTIKVTTLEDDRTIGTGIVIETGQILTCARVVREATGADPRYEEWREVGLVFTQASAYESRHSRIRPARVVHCFQRDQDGQTGYEDDIVLLELVDGQPPIPPESYARLGDAEPSFAHDFQSLAYVPLDAYPPQYAEGKIIHYVPPHREVLRVETVQLKTDGFEPGMSGAGVLDTERNLVVGLVTEGHDRKPVAWATDHKVLTFEPFNLPLHGEALPLKPIAPPQPAMPAPRVQVGLGHRLENAPAPLAEWVGREQLLRDLDADWNDPNVRLTGLIGFGGEGKSSLARRWVEHLLQTGGASESDAVAGVFWWPFYDKPDAEAFLEAAVTWLGGEQLAQTARSATTRAEIVGALLREGRYLFVLDGLEVLQEQEGDRYGQIRSRALLDLLDYFAAEGHRSFCLLTSRAPLLDLLPLTAYRHRDVARLLPEDGRALLRTLGATDDEAGLDAVVKQWDGHALTLSLVGALAAQYGGDAREASAGLEIAPPSEEGERPAGPYADQYDHVRRVLLRYDEHLTAEERDFLQRFSVYRTPVEVIQVSKLQEGRLEGEELDVLVTRLVGYLLLRRDEAAGTITTHPLVRNYYLAKLQAAGAADAHQRAKEYYLERAGDTHYNPTLADLEPLIEVVYHAYRAGAYDEAIDLVWRRLLHGDRRILYYQLGAYETYLSVLLMFFPDGDTSQLPSVSSRRDQRLILNEVGLCLMYLGRLAEAVPFYERHNKSCVEKKDWHNASAGYQNVADLLAQLGRLAECSQAAENALQFGRRGGKKRDEMPAWAWLGWSAHLLGEVVVAAEAFQKAEALEHEIDWSSQYLYSLRGIQHADHLRRVEDGGKNAGAKNAGGEVEGAYARRITEANLAMCQSYGWAKSISQCHRVLGDLDADAGEHTSAGDHYDEALRIARSIQHRPALIEALLARGCWRARLAGLEPPPFGTGELLLQAARADLDEALGYAVGGGYRVYECDIRIGLAWAYYHGGDPSAARQQAGRAAAMAQEMGYHWGQVDAEEIAALL